MMLKDYSATLQLLLKRLRVSRARLLRRRILQLSLWAGITATGVFLLVELSRYLAPSLLPLSEDAALIAALSVLALTLVLGLGHIWLSAPDMRYMARLADRRFDLEERLSTALELEEAEPEDELTASLRKALWQDIADRLERVRPQELVEIPFPRQAWYLMTVLAAVLALQLAPTLSPAPTVALNPVMSAEELAEATIAVRQAAAIAAQDAEWRNDPYLHAVALALEQLGKDLEQRGLSAEQAEAELGRLVDHLVRAYGLEEQVSADADLEEIMSSAERSQEGAAAGPPDPGGEGDQALAEDAEGGLEAAEGPADQHSDGEDLDGDGGGEEAGQEQAPEAAQAPGGEGPDAERQWQEGYDYDTYYDDYADHDAIGPELRARLERERQLQEQLRREAPLDRDLGADDGEGLEGNQALSDEAAGEGEGVEAGTGTQALFGEGEDALWTNGTPEDFELPFDPESRRRIRVEMPPQARLSEIGEGQAGADGNWGRRREVPVPAEFLSALKRHIASEYFRPRRQAAEP